LATILRIRGLEKSFGPIEALRGLDLEVEQGEFFALLGPSASGKTTILRSICGIEKPDNGHIYFDGEDVTGAEVRGRDIAMVFQTFALYPHLRVSENLAYPLRRAGVPAREINQRVGEIAEMLRLGHTLERQPGTASGGEQQRIAIGRALIRRPKLLLLDEPLTNLDAKLRHDTRAEFKRLHRELDMTIVYATPDQLEALTMGQRIALLREGRITQTGTPDDLYDAPGDTFAAGMIGAPNINLIQGVRSGTDDTAGVALPFAEIADGPWSEPLRRFPVGTKVVFGVRPNDIAPAGAGHDGKRITARVHLTEPLGDVVILDLNIGDTFVKMVLPEEQAVGYAVGDELPIALQVQNTHVFAQETGTAIR
jgi:multiple sugar transport system ATP-binding protein